MKRLIYSDIYCITFVPENLTAIMAAISRSTKDITKSLARVKSSNLWSMGIDIDEYGDNVGNVYIQFKNENGGPGDIYEYFDVPIKLYRKLVGAPSKGHAFWKLIRNNFQYRKLTGDRKGKLKNAVN